MGQHNIDIPILSILENVASCSPDVVNKYTQLTGGQPVLIEAGMWGWVHRKRLFWLACEAWEGAVTQNLSTTDTRKLQLPEGFSLSQHASLAGVFDIQRDTAKAWPGTVLFEDGFTPAIAPGASTAHAYLHAGIFPPSR